MSPPLRSRTPLALLVVLGLLASNANPLQGQPLSREAELEELRGEIASLQNRLVRVQRRQEGLEGELRQTELAVRLQEKRVAEARTAGRLAEEKLVRLEAEIARLEAEVERLRQAIERRVVDLYRLGRQGYLRLLLSIRSERHVLPGMRLLRFMVRRDNGLLNRLRDARARLALEKEEAVERRLEVEVWQRQEAERLDQLDRLRRRQATLLARLEREREDLSRRAARLVSKERKLSNFLDFLYGRTSAKLSGTPMQEFQGVLDWPVQGGVTRGFGPRRDPRYKTEVPHNGLEFSTGGGSEVRAVFPGKVLFAAPFQGFGLTAIVHHPGRVFSLYAGLEELRVTQGDMLSLAQVIGVSSDTLYFEIRVENRPVDPQLWLR